MNDQSLSMVPTMDVTLMIGGKAVPATGGATYARLNPVTGAVATRAAAAATGDAEAAASAAARGLSGLVGTRAERAPFPASRRGGAS